jgi:hypothetical protein
MAWRQEHCNTTTSKIIAEDERRAAATAALYQLLPLNTEASLPFAVL